MLLVLGVISIRQKLVLKLLHPRLYEEYVETYSKEFSIDENLVYSIMKVESKFNKTAISNKRPKD
ncbi:transglycosylase SLT domain-containing protein [Paraclostridium bifermentans]|nr:transglycosylase SLT domain-containing protein [Paraclostridium bifermentans]